MNEPLKLWEVLPLLNEHPDRELVLQIATGDAEAEAVHVVACKVGQHAFRPAIVLTAEIVEDGYVDGGVHEDVKDEPEEAEKKIKELNQTLDKAHGLVEQLPAGTVRESLLELLIRF